jgi:hypothetical protein
VASIPEAYTKWRTREQFLEVKLGGYQNDWKVALNRRTPKCFQRRADSLRSSLVAFLFLAQQHGGNLSTSNARKAIP